MMQNKVACCFNVLTSTFVTVRTCPLPKIERMRISGAAAISACNSGSVMPAPKLRLDKSILSCSEWLKSVTVT